MREGTLRLRWPRIGVDVALLRATSFRRYYLGQLLSNFGDTLMPLALAFAVLNLTGSATALGVVLLTSRVPILVFTLIGGVAGDRLPRRAVMIVSDLVRMAAHLATGALLIAGEARLWHLVALQLVAGTAAAFFDPAASGLVRDVVERDRLTQANALLSLSRNGNALCAIAASGALVATVGPGWAFAMNGASFAASALFLSGLTLPDRAVAAAQATFVAQLEEGLRYVTRHAWLLVSILYLAFLNAVVISPLMVLGPIVARDRLGGAASWAAILIGTAVGSIVGSTFSLRLRPRRSLVSALGVVLAAVPFAVLLAVGAPVWTIVVAAFLFGAQSSVSNILITSLIQRAVPADAIARVTSYTRLGSLIFAPLGFAGAGLAADRWGPSTVLWFSAAWILVSTAAALSSSDVRSADAEASDGE